MHVALLSPRVSDFDLARARARGRLAGILDAAFDCPPNVFSAWVDSDCAAGTLTAFRHAYVGGYSEVADSPKERP